MLSFSKILLTAGVIVLVFWVYRSVEARGRIGRRRMRPAPPERPVHGAASGPIEDLHPCPRCGAYVAAGHRCDGAPEDR